MHAVTHSLAHRAPPATRTRVRWQPYNSIHQQTPVPSRTPASIYLNTPASSVTSSSPSSTPSSEIERIRQSSVPQTPRESQSRESAKNKYVMGLVDQAVKSLCEIWKPQDIPAVFLTSSRVAVQTNTEHTNMSRKRSSRHSRNPQLPSPASPSSHSSPLSPPSSTAPECVNAHRKPSVSAAEASQTNLVPIKVFVHEVLRRSRTSGGILQTALCYLEAIRSKVPDLVRREQMGEGSREEPELASRITVDDDASIGMIIDKKFDTENTTGATDTVRMCDATLEASQADLSSKLSLANGAPRKPKVPSPPLAPLPPLPSPLLCPRRAFLASLILASKFTQDRCYSNRAWAKLSGLPPREIGRCERALGDALEWRLWVGKAPVAPATADRSVIRSRSDGDLLAGSHQKSVWKESSCSKPRVEHILSLAHQQPPPYLHPQQRGGSGLRRCSTMPAEAISNADPPNLQGGYLSQLATVALQIGESTTISTGPQYTSEYASSVASSSSPPTPTLTSSPSSTDSSCDGDRTVQMTGFVDDAFTGSGCFAPQGEAITKVYTSNGCYAPHEGIAKPLGYYQFNTPIATQEQHAPAYPYAPFGVAPSYAFTTNIGGLYSE
jgi:hypothetical protein